MFSKHLDLGRPLKTSSWRKIAIGTWRTAGDPSVYGSMEMDVERAMIYIRKMSEKTGTKITFTHFLGKAVALTLEKHPEINCVLRFGRLYPRKSIDIFFQVAIDESGKELSGVTIRNANHKSLVEMANEMKTQVEAVRKKGDPVFSKTKKLMSRIPGFFIHTAIQWTGFLMYSLNLWSPLLGSPKDPFGSVMITSIGSLGLDTAFAPLVPYSRIPMLLAVGTIKEIPVVKDGKITIAQVSNLCGTFDHRLIDGMHASHIVKTLQKIFAHPEGELGPL